MSTMAASAPAHAALGASFASALERSNDVVAVLTPRGVVQWGNEAARSALGVEPVGQCLVDLADALSRDALERALAGQASAPEPFTLFLSQPARELEVTVTPDGSGLLVLVGRPRALPPPLCERLDDLNRRYVEKVRELASLTGRLREAAVTDSLTNLFNRRAFLDQAEVEWERTRRHGALLGIVMFDLDHFKEVNDRHGHAAGDLVLRSFSLILRTTVRMNDIPARYGGEEFVALLPQTDLEGAVLLAERVRQRFAEQPVEIPGAGPVTVTCSAGVGRSEGYLSLQEALVAADRALYQAKQDGRDCVRVVPFERDAA